MLEMLHEAETLLPYFLQDESQWKDLFVNYEPPFVERLWMQWGEYRIYLHRIHSCKKGEALFHPHPWPSAIKILSGEYEMLVGYGPEDNTPTVAMTLNLGPGTEYEMINRLGWHSVRPLAMPSMSLMVTGKPWQSIETKNWKNAPVHAPMNLPGLKKKQREELFEFFRYRYPTH